MKKLLIFMLVLGMASLANATIIDVGIDGTGDSGHTGLTTDDKLASGETIHIAIELGYRTAHPTYGPTEWPSYHGYITDGIQLDLQVSSAASLGADGTEKVGKGFVPAAGNHASWDTKNYHGYSYEMGSYMDDITNNTMAFSYGSLSSVNQVDTDAEKLIWDMYIVADGSGTDIVISLVNLTGGRYKNYVGESSWTTLTSGDLGSLTLYQVPEPATIALLGLGGLFLSRRRR